MEKLAAEGTVTDAASGSKNPDGKANHWPSGAVSTKEESEKVRRMAAERQDMNEVVEEQQAARVEVHGPKRRAVIRVVRRNARLCS